MGSYLKKPRILAFLRWLARKLASIAGLVSHLVSDICYIITKNNMRRLE